MCLFYPSNVLLTQLTTCPGCRQRGHYVKIHGIVALGGLVNINCGPYFSFYILELILSLISSLTHYDLYLWQALDFVWPP